MSLLAVNSSPELLVAAVVHGLTRCRRLAAYKSKKSCHQDARETTEEDRHGTGAWCVLYPPETR